MTVNDILCILDSKINELMLLSDEISAYTAYSLNTCLLQFRLTSNFKKSLTHQIKLSESLYRFYQTEKFLDGDNENVCAVIMNVLEFLTYLYTLIDKDSNIIRELNLYV